MAEASQALDLSPIDAYIESVGPERGALIPVLQKAQEAFGYLPQEALDHISDRLDVPLADVVGVATFYSQFSLTRRGKTVIRLCDGTACHVGGAAKSIDLVHHALGIKPGETSPDYEYSLEVVYCLGACAISPVAVVNGQVVGRATPERVKQLLAQVAAGSPSPPRAGEGVGG